VRRSTSARQQGETNQVKNAISLMGCVLLAAGCAGLAGGMAAVGDAKGQADAAKGAADGAKDQAKGEADKAKAGGAKGAGDKGAEDDTRLKATDSGVNGPLDDSVDFKKDQLDWRKFMLKGKSGVATFEVHWDDEKSDLTIDVYNSFGDLIGKSPRKLQGLQAKRVLIQVDQPGLYYVKVTAPSKDDHSIYTLKVLWDGEKVDKPAGGDAQANANPPPANPPPGTPPPAGANGQPPAANGQPPAPVAPIPFAQDPNKVLANIVTAYRDGAGWVLQIDKGASQKLRSGQTGSVLDGADGDKLLDGATLTVAQVVGDTKAIARCPMSKPLGKNKRIVINLK
jgi:hypothetical protein